MAVMRRRKLTTLLQLLLTPTLLLSITIRKPVFQWLAVIIAVLWLVFTIASAMQRHHWKKPQRKEPSVSKEKSSQETRPQGLSVSPLSPQDLFLIRQLNCRITEHLKVSYPMVAWIWYPRPQLEELSQGGTWRIRISNADPFNYGDVEIDKSGKLSITLLQAVPLSEASETKVILKGEPDDLLDDELMDRTDAKTWYLDQGERIIAEIIDNLNSQCHKQLLIKDDGSVTITASGAEQVVESIVGFPPRMTWDDFCQLLYEDDIKASIGPEGLILAW